MIFARFKVNVSEPQEGPLGHLRSALRAGNYWMSRVVGEKELTELREHFPILFGLEPGESPQPSYPS